MTNDDATRPEQGGTLPPLLNAVEETPRANIVADIVGHPQGAPSKAELQHMNPSIDEPTLSDHLNALEEADVIEIQSTETHEFVRLTEQAQQTFADHDIFQEDAYRDAYDQVSKPTEIQELEQIERPSPDAK